MFSNFTFLKRILVSGSPCVNKHPYDFKLQIEGMFPKSFLLRLIEKYDKSALTSIWDTSTC